MIRKVDHIGIAVRSVEKALKIYRDVLGLELVKIEEVKEEKVKIAILKVGDTYIELLEPLTEDSSLHKFLSKRGEGIHHIALKVDDISKACEELKRKQLKILYEKPRELKDRKINFIHPKNVYGVLLEIIERS